MRRSTAFLAFLMFSALLINLSSAEAGGGNCQAKLAGSSYTCDFKFSNGASETLCVEFGTGGVSSNFDLFIPPSTDYGCACQATGSFKSPSFNGSASAFECSGDDFGTQLDGKVAGKKISGEGSGYSGESIVFSCEKISACT